MNKPALNEKSLPGRPSHHMLPGVRTAMKETGFTRVSSLCRAFDAALSARFEQPLTYTKVLDITNGEGCFDSAGAAYSLEGEMLAEFLNRHPQDLFGPLPADPHDYDVDPDELCTEERIPGFTQPEDYALQREREKALERCFEQLSLTDKRGVQILRWRYGIGDEGPFNRQEIAEKMDLTVTRIKHLQDRAEARLRALIVKSYARTDNRLWCLQIKLDI